MTRSSRKTGRFYPLLTESNPREDPENSRGEVVSSLHPHSNPYFEHSIVLQASSVATVFRNDRNSASGRRTCSQGARFAHLHGNEVYRRPVVSYHNLLQRKKSKKGKYIS